ncbi:MAG: RdgB/HAM1 family non-canonical purine NTP pyrophosphatase [Thiotrichaceae bacterium]
MKTIVLASNNPGKINEFNQLLAEFGLQVIPQQEFNLPSVPETGLSFVENALIKARYAAQHTGLAALADDSGIEVDALQGAPGIYSARFAGENASDAENNQLLIKKLATTPPLQRTACYHCVIVFMRHATDPIPLICQGTWAGEIVLEARGTQGFGYDPYFYVPTHQCTAAELPPEVKNQISHRALAFQQFRQMWHQQYGKIS